MPIVHIDAHVHTAVAAASSAYALAVEYNSSAHNRVHVAELARVIRQLQAYFDLVKPLSELSQTRVAAVLSASYGVSDPAAVLALIPTAQAAGLAVIATIVGSENGPTQRAAYDYNDETGAMDDVLLTAAETSGMSVPWAALATALAPIAAD